MSCRAQVLDIHKPSEVHTDFNKETLKHIIFLQPNKISSYILSKSR